MKICKTCNQKLTDTKQPGYKDGYGLACLQKIEDRMRTMGQCARLRNKEERTLRNEINKRAEFTEPQKEKCIQYFKDAINIAKDVLYQACINWNEMSNPRKMFNKKMKLEAYKDRIIGEGETRFTKKLARLVDELGKAQMRKKEYTSKLKNLNDNFLTTDEMGIGTKVSIYQFEIKEAKSSIATIKKELKRVQKMEDEKGAGVSYLTKLDVVISFESLYIGMSSIEDIGGYRGFIKPSLAEQKHYARKLAEAINLVFETDSERAWKDTSIMPIVRRVGLNSYEFRHWINSDIKKYILSILFKDDKEDS